MRVRLILIGASVLLASCVGRPAFIPTAHHLYERFAPLSEPRPEVPVGALWIEGYGAEGEGAAAENLTTTRSLSGFTFDADFQAGLTLGVLRFLDLDPSFRKKVTARFSDLTVTRVKDWTKLSGPPGEWRIYETLKAGTISITTTGSGGFDIENHALSHHTPIVGRGTTGLTRTFVIDGKDLVFAISVARSRSVHTPPVRVQLTAGKPKLVMLGSYALRLTAPAEKDCRGEITYSLSKAGASWRSLSGGLQQASTSISLPAPEAISDGSLMTAVQLNLEEPLARSCLHRTLQVRRTGEQLARRTGALNAPDW